MRGEKAKQGSFYPLASTSVDNMSASTLTGTINIWAAFEQLFLKTRICKSFRSVVIYKGHSYRVNLVVMETVTSEKHLLCVTTRVEKVAIVLVSRQKNCNSEQTQFIKELRTT